MYATVVRLHFNMVSNLGLFNLKHERKISENFIIDNFIEIINVTHCFVRKKKERIYVCLEPK